MKNSKQFVDLMKENIMLERNPKQINKIYNSNRSTHFLFQFIMDR